MPHFLLGFPRHCLLLKPPLLLLRPLPQSLSGFGDLRPGLLPGSAVVPQELLDVRGTLAARPWGVWNSATEINPNVDFNLWLLTRPVNEPGIVSIPAAVDHFLPELLQVFFTSTGRPGLGGGSGLLWNGPWVFAGTQTPRSATRLEMFFPLLPRPLDAPAVPERLQKWMRQCNRCNHFSIFKIEGSI